MERFRAYQRKYSVYSDIVLLSTSGEVLARLDETSGPARSRDPLIDECLATSAAYIETYRQSDLQPGDEQALIYSYRVMSSDGRSIVGVLCLCFRFADECRRVFSGLIGSNDWCVITLVDRNGRVIASSDEHQAPLAARIAESLQAETHVVRFAGRPFLSTICRSNGYQGYLGPGWCGHAMLPLEFAFNTDDDSALVQGVAPEQLAAIMASETLFSEALRDIPRAASSIQAELNRAVWNGNVALAGTASANSSFSKTLLREIGQTGMRTRDLFAQAIANMNQTVVSSIMRDCRAKAALSIDIMDRNLYERANDCRWWALTTAFREALARPPLDANRAHDITKILATINGLYTVYANLVLFDANGRIVAVSNPEYRERVGQTLDRSWVRETLALGNSESYCVSAFEPSDLYADRHTYIYCAAICALEARGRVVGGIAIVFDSAPQFPAMLSESLPRAENGEIKLGAFGVFLDRDGRVIASSRGDLAIGSALNLGYEELPRAPGASWQKLLPFEGKLYAVGACHSSGYREYKSHSDPYRNDVTAVVFLPLATQAPQGRRAARSVALRLAHKTPRYGAQEQTLDLASFAVGANWYAVPADDVVEAVQPHVMASLPGAPPYIRGCVKVRDSVLAVLDLAMLLDGTSSRRPSPQTVETVVIVRAGKGRPDSGLWVDELGDTPEVASSRMVPACDVIRTQSVLIDKVVAPDAARGDDSMLILLSTDRLADCAEGAEQPLSA